MRKIFFLSLALFLTVFAPCAMAKRSVMPQEEFLEICARGKLADVGRGVRRKADVNKIERNGLSPLIIAAREQDDPRVIEYLVQNGADVEGANFQGYTPLMFAAMYNPVVRVTQALIKCGASPERCDSFGQNAINYAARHNSNAAVLGSLLNGRDVNVKSASGETPLMNAAQNKNLRIVSFLLSRGADLRSCDGEGRSALHFAAASNSNEKVVAELLDAGADVNCRTNSGMTPLMQAARTGLNPAVVELLIDRGADVNARSADGRRAADFAAENPAIATSSAFKKLQ